MNTNSILYSLKVWLTSVCLAPAMFIIIDSFTSENNYSSVTNFVSEKITIYAACVIFGGIISFFTWILFILIIKGIITCFSSFKLLKQVIAGVGVLLTLGTFAIFFRVLDIFNEPFYLIISNCICIAGGSCFYKLEIITEPNVISN
jgi:FtsH-binding integral membrane protein